MSRSRSQEYQRGQGQDAAAQVNNEVEEGEDFGSESEDNGEPEKDETEEELERLVFGDSAGFREGLKDFTLEQEEQEDDDVEDTGLEGLDDADLFFTDTAPNGDAYQPSTSTHDEDDTTLRSRHPPAWEDSDDERMLVSLASVPRLRKLRISEAEDVVNGKEYAKRLRRQFELLNPTPEWARQAMAVEQGPARKRRRLSGNVGTGSEDDEDMDVDSDNDTPSAAPLTKLLQDASSLVRQSGSGAGKKRKLRPEVLDIQRQKDISIPNIAPISSLSFHPTLPLLLSSSSSSSTLCLHHLTPPSLTPTETPNPLLTSMHVRGTPLTTTAFHPQDDRIFLGARRKYFHIWNLHSGQVEKITRPVYGQKEEQRSMERFKISPSGAYLALLGSARKGGGLINILDVTTMQWVSSVRIESRGGIAEFAWWNDSKGLCIAGKSGEVTEWSLAEQEVKARWWDEGAVGVTTLALGGQHEFKKSAIGSDRWVVVGSSSGIVNVYDRRAWLTSPPPPGTQHQAIPTHPKPLRVLDHLTTPISHLAFSPDGQILCMASRWKRDALRLVHLPSCTVFKNWPTSSTPLGRITGVAFAGGQLVAGSGSEGDADEVHSVLAVANEAGKIRVWEIR